MNLQSIYEQKDLFCAGVYRLFNTQNERSYIGTAQSVVFRVYTHCQQLNTHRHRRLELQADWDAYGWQAFRFEVLHRVDDDRARLYWEAYYMTFGGFNLYNCARDIEDRRYATLHAQYRQYVNV